MPRRTDEETTRLTFAGFTSPNTTPVPDELFDTLAPQLTEGELRVLLYVIRRTFGFKKQADRISISQMTGGIRRRDGSTLDRGTGMGKAAVLRSVKSLVEVGILEVERAESEQGDADVNTFRLHFREGVDSLGVHPGIPKIPQVDSLGIHRVDSLGVPQETEQQETGNKVRATDDWKLSLAETMTPTNYRRWIAPLELLELVNNHAVLAAPNSAAADYAQKRLADRIADALGVERIEVRTADRG